MSRLSPLQRSVLVKRIASHGPQLHARAVRLVGRDAAEDLVQSTFERALRRLDSFCPQSNLQAWLRRILCNLAVDGWRGERRRALATRMMLAEEAAPPAEEETPCWQMLTGTDVDHAVAALPASSRDIFRMHQRDHLTYAQISSQLGLQASTVGTRLLRARARLRMILGDVLAEREAMAVAPANDGGRRLPAHRPTESTNRVAA